jgi:Na+-transporting NADH:ubiquinone oxidoreductase subunit NqrB
MRASALFQDLRLRVSVVIMGLQVLGQVALGFKVSIAQIAVSIGTCVAIDVGVACWRRRPIVWPASAILTGNGVGLILRAAGTRHGDWWSLNGIQYFVLAAVIGIASKYLIQLRGRHVYNPSNLGLVACLLIAGPFAVFPQYLWWGYLSVPLAIVFLLIFAGALWVLMPLRMVAMALAFLVPFVAGIAILAATGHCFAALWNAGPVCGSDYWAAVCLSPEVLVFVFFMISDPRTTPETPVARILHGALTAFIALALITLQSTEYGIKLALLASLTLSCSFSSLGQLISARRRSRPNEAPPMRREFTPRLMASASVVAVALISLSVPLYLSRLAGNQDIRAVEEGRPPPGIPGQG